MDSYPSLLTVHKQAHENKTIKHIHKLQHDMTCCNLRITHLQTISCVASASDRLYTDFGNTTRNMNIKKKTRDKSQMLKCDMYVMQNANAFWQLTST